MECHVIAVFWGVRLELMFGDTYGMRHPIGLSGSVSAKG